MSRAVIRFLEIAGSFPGKPHIQEGSLLESFQDTPCGRGNAKWTLDLEKALRFPSVAKAFEFYRRRSATVPTRDDGKPNRPLTAYTVMIERLEL